MKVEIGPTDLAGYPSKVRPPWRDCLQVNSHHNLRSGSYRLCTQSQFQILTSSIRDKWGFAKASLARSFSSRDLLKALALELLASASCDSTPKITISLVGICFCERLIDFEARVHIWKRGWMTCQCHEDAVQYLLSLA